MYLLIKIQNISIFLGSYFIPFPSIPLLTFPQAIKLWFLSLCITWPVFKLNEIIQTVFFHVWLFLFNILCDSFFMSISILFFFNCWIMLYGRKVPQLGYCLQTFRYFQLGANMNEGTMNILVSCICCVTALLKCKSHTIQFT